MLYSDAVQRQEDLGFDFAKARASFIARIERELVTERGDLFALYEYEWDRVLLYWQREKAAAYLLERLASQPDLWATLARYTLGRGGMSLRNSLDRDHRNRSIAITETGRWRSPKTVHRDRWSGQSGRDHLNQSEAGIRLGAM